MIEVSNMVIAVVLVVGMVKEEGFFILVMWGQCLVWGGVLI